MYSLWYLLLLIDFVRTQPAINKWAFFHTKFFDHADIVVKHMHIFFGVVCLCSEIIFGLWFIALQPSFLYDQMLKNMCAGINWICLEM